ncbi:MAG: putative toxin-antitoxin system toxin component, PIN family [Prevotellaceae bacterium]|jgi:putative PIN family toxin of toxin-antitoxin system|nr:putative toxin-antitoxin system toxin component, PIN family [Prevotellaceae bacterium]
MKIVVDASIVVSAFILGGEPRKVIERVFNCVDKLYVTKEILAEFTDAVNRPKFCADADETKSYIRKIALKGRKATPPKRSRNRNGNTPDNKYIACGAAGNAAYIISGDAHLLELKQYENIRILTAKEYLETMSKLEAYFRASEALPSILEMRNK